MNKTHQLFGRIIWAEYDQLTHVEIGSIVDACVWMKMCVWACEKGKKESEKKWVWVGEKKSVRGCGGARQGGSGGFYGTVKVNRNFLPSLSSFPIMNRPSIWVAVGNLIMSKSGKILGTQPAGRRLNLFDRNLWKINGYRYLTVTVQTIRYWTEIIFSFPYLKILRSWIFY